jgi:hypothetical protein
MTQQRKIWPPIGAAPATKPDIWRDEEGQFNRVGWWDVLAAMEHHAEATNDPLLWLVTEELSDAIDAHWALPPGYVLEPDEEKRWGRAQSIMLTWLMRQAAL